MYYQDYHLDEQDYLLVPTTSLVMPVLTTAFLQQGLCNSLATCSGLPVRSRMPPIPGSSARTARCIPRSRQATWNINDSWKLSAGGRYSSEDKDGSRATQLTRGLGGPNLPPQVVPLFNAVLGIVPHSISGERSEDHVLAAREPAVFLQPRVHDVPLLGAGLQVGRLRRPLEQAAGRWGGTFEFEDEEATTYELGLKTAIGTTAEINAAAFFTDYKDLQTSAFDGAIGFNVGNGSAEVMGVEVEGRWRVTPQLHAVRRRRPGWISSGPIISGSATTAWPPIPPVSPMPAIATTRDSATSWHPSSPAMSAATTTGRSATACVSA